MDGDKAAKNGGCLKNIIIGFFVLQGGILVSGMMEMFFHTGSRLSLLMTIILFVLAALAMGKIRLPGTTGRPALPATADRPATAAVPPSPGMVRTSRVMVSGLRILAFIAGSVVLVMGLGYAFLAFSHPLDNAWGMFGVVLCLMVYIGITCTALAFAGAAFYIAFRRPKP